MTHNGAMDELQKINVRFPDILYRRMQAKIKEQQALDPGCSMNSYILRLVREDIDGREDIQHGTFVTMATYATGNMTPSSGNVAGRKPSAAELAARFGIKTGATIEEVEPFVEAGLPAEIHGVQRSGGGSLGPDEGREPVVVETEDQTLWRKKCESKFSREMVNIPKVHRKMWAGMSWEQRYEWLAEKKERGE